MKGKYDLVNKSVASLAPDTETGCNAHVCHSRAIHSKLLTLLLITVVTALLLVFQCLHPGLLHGNLLCCQKPMAAYTGRLAYDENEDGTSRIRYKHTKRRLPQALIIGVRKGGTRALIESLNLHPSVQAEKREMHFFDDEDNYNSGLEWYRKRMPYSFPDQITIEKTPAYFTAETAPERVYKMNKTIKLLLVVRDPVERAISDYTQVRENKIERGKPHELFENLAIDPQTGEVVKSYRALRRSLYHRHIERWLRWFPLQQFHLISGENLVKNPVQEIRKVESFLGLEHKLKDENFYFNKTRGFYCLRWEREEKCLAPSKGRKHPEINPHIITKLRQFFRPHNEKFYENVGINFGWP